MYHNIDLLDNRLQFAYGIIAIATGFVVPAISYVYAIFLSILYVVWLKSCPISVARI